MTSVVGSLDFARLFLLKMAVGLWCGSVNGADAPYIEARVLNSKNAETDFI